MATTVDEVMGILKDVAERQADLAQAQQRTEEAQQRTEEVLRASRQEVAQAQQKTEEAQQKTEEFLREMQRAVAQTQKNIDKANGNFNTKWGRFLENLVKGDLVKLLASINIEVQRVQPRLIVPATEASGACELDLVAMNGEEIVVVEVKTTATREKVDRFLKQLRTFKLALPEYRDKRIYGALAYLSEPEGEGEGGGQIRRRTGPLSDRLPRWKIECLDPGQWPFFLSPDILGPPGQKNLEKTITAQ